MTQPNEEQLLELRKSIDRGLAKIARERQKGRFYSSELETAILDADDFLKELGITSSVGEHV